MKHWEHTERVEETTYREFVHHNVPIKPSVELPFNTAVFVECTSGGKRLEGVYDPTVSGIRNLKSSNAFERATNRDLRLYIDAIQSEHLTMIAVDGLPGTGKTSTVIKDLIKKHLHNVTVSDNDLFDYTKPLTDAHKIWIAKPLVNASGEEYGFLPGDINEKIAPTLKNYTQYFDREHPSGFKALNSAGYVEILPLGFIRGTDAEDVTVVVDECQNTKELYTVATRRAKGSRFFYLGDSSPFQIDLPGNTPKKNGLVDLIDLLRGAPYFQYIEFKSLEHIVRSDEARDVIRRLMKRYGEDPQEWI